MRANPVLFSPIHLNIDGNSTEKLLALYRFAHLFLPQLGPGIVQTLLDMERHGERLSAGVSPEERRKLIGEMKGLSMDIQYALKDEGQKMFELSVHIVPGEVLERAQQGKVDLGQYTELRENIDKFIIQLIEKEVRKRFTSKVEGFMKTMLNKPGISSFVGWLLDSGRVDRKGRLQEGTTIDDLISGKYRAKFEELAPEELMQEGLQIRETIKTCFSVRSEDDDSLLQDAERRYALLEITINSAKDDTRAGGERVPGPAAGRQLHGR